jgi:hypothetical protein
MRLHQLPKTPHAREKWVRFVGDLARAARLTLMALRSMMIELQFAAWNSVRV